MTTLNSHRCHVTGKYYLWYLKDLHTIVLIDSEVNHTYKLIGIEVMRESIATEKFLQNNIVDHSALPCLIGSTAPTINPTDFLISFQLSENNL